jgi:tetratricopeptide (TPR) repeat protein
MKRPTLYINAISELDWLIALEFGRVDDAQPPDNWRGVSRQFGYLCDGPEGPEVGFKILDFSKFDPNEPEVAEIWDGPRFDCPLLGLTGATAGEIVLAGRALLTGSSTVNRAYFDRASGASGDEAIALWTACLQAGDSMAHFGLGSELYIQGRYQDAYRHLRHYAEIAPHGTWNQCWYGKAALKVGEITEARRAFERAIELEDQGGASTDARRLLDELGGSDRPAEG